MRVIVLGAGGRHKTEASIARAVRSLGHPCRLINAVTLTRYLNGLAAPLVRRGGDAFAPDALILTPHQLRLGAPVAPRRPHGRATHARTALRLLVLRPREPAAPRRGHPGPSGRRHVRHDRLAGGPIPGGRRPGGAPPPAGRRPGNRPPRVPVTASLSLRSVVRGVGTVLVPARAAAVRGRGVPPADPRPRMAQRAARPPGGGRARLGHAVR